MTRLSVKAGAPDLLMLWRGRVCGVELKGPGGTVSEVQQQMHRKLHACGVPVAVCRSLEEVADALREWGVSL